MLARSEDSYRIGRTHRMASFRADIGQLRWRSRRSVQAESRCASLTRNTHRDRLSEPSEALLCGSLSFARFSAHSAHVCDTRISIVAVVVLTGLLLCMAHVQNLQAAVRIESPRGIMDHVAPTTMFAEGRICAQSGKGECTHMKRTGHSCPSPWFSACWRRVGAQPGWRSLLHLALSIWVSSP